MLARSALVTCAAAATLAVFWACGAGPKSPAATASSAVDGGRGEGGVRDAAVPLFGGACPEDAPWTGTVCLGQGYVACPGGYSMDDRSRCVRVGGTDVDAAGDDDAGADDDEAGGKSAP